MSSATQFTVFRTAEKTMKKMITRTKTTLLIAEELFLHTQV
jgi:hypothetical protein